MQCSICQLTSIPSESLLCPRCGSLVDREEIINAKDDQLASVKSNSVLKGKLVEMAQKKERFKKQASTQKIWLYILGFGLFFSLLYNKFYIPKIVESPANQELRDSLNLLSSVHNALIKRNRFDPPPKEKAPEPTKNIYTVKKGDSLTSIANTFYGDMKKYKDIAVANQLTPPYMLKSGDQLVLPEVPETVTTSL